MSETDPIGFPASHHEERLLGVGTIANKRIVPDQALYAQAHFSTLQHVTEVTPMLCGAFCEGLTGEHGSIGYLDQQRT